MKKPIKAVLLIQIDEVEFDYLDIKNSIAKLFENRRINLQVGALGLNA